MRYIESNSVITGGKIIFYNNGKFNFIDSTGNMEFGKWITYENKHITLIYDFEPETPIEFSEFELFENCIRLTCHKDFLIVYELCKLQ